MDPPIVSELHPNSATITWTPPSPPNGIITNYRLCVCPSSVCSSSVPLSFSSDSKPSLPSYDKAADLNSYRNLRSSSVSPSSGPIAMSHVSMGSGGGSSTIRGYRFSVPDPASTVTEGAQIMSVHKTSPGSSSVSVSSVAQPTAASVKTNRSPPSSAHPKRESFQGRMPDCFTAASDSNSVTVPGNITTSSLPDLLPFQTYMLQVECNSMACLQKQSQYLKLNLSIIRMINHWSLITFSTLLSFL